MQEFEDRENVVSETLTEEAPQQRQGIPGHPLLFIVGGILLFVAGFGVNALLNPGSSDTVLRELQADVADVKSRSDRIEQRVSEMQSYMSDIRDVALGVVRVSADDDPVLGSADAPVTIIEFSDFECPFCQRFHAETLPSLVEEYINPGTVRLVFRDFPLTNIHDKAVTAAIAAECADDQGKFWPMHDLIFENQRQWASSEDAEAEFKAFAQRLQLDFETFETCLVTQQHLEEVSNDLQDGVQYGVGGTPYFFVNGIGINGAQPISVFRNMIAEALARSGE